MPLPFQPKPLDADAAAFIQRSGATDRAAINAFVRGVKALGLWNNMVCWPLRSSQNAGNGDTVHSLGGLGTFNGTRVNGPAWTADGINAAAMAERIRFGSASALHSYGPFSFFSVQKHDSLPVAPNFDVSLWTRDDASWPASTRLTVYANSVEHRLNVSNTRRIYSGFIAVDPAPWHSQLTASAGDETGFVTYNKGTPTAFGAATADAATPTGPWELRGDANITCSFYLISHQNIHASREALYDLYKSTLGTGLGLP